MEKWCDRFRKAILDILWIDELAGMSFGAIAPSAVLRWPDKTIADITFQTAFLASSAIA